MKYSKKQVLGLAAFVAVNSAVGINSNAMEVSYNDGNVEGHHETFKKTVKQQLTQEGVNAKIKEILSMEKENRKKLAELVRHDFTAFAKENFELTAYHERCLKYKWQDENSKEVVAAIANAIEKANTIEANVTLLNANDAKNLFTSNSLGDKKRKFEAGYESDDRGWYFGFTFEF